MKTGIAASPGIAIGKVWVSEQIELDIPTHHVYDPDEEIARFQQAVQKANQQVNELREQAKLYLSEHEAAIFDAHMMLLRDPELTQAIVQHIKEEHFNAAKAVQSAIKLFVDSFEQIDMDYMRERAVDIRDVGMRVLRILLDIEPRSLEDLTEPVLIVAHDLTPSDTAQMNRKNVLGFATDIGGRTSHSAIMARSLEIPAVVGLKNISQEVRHGDCLIVDGDEGTVIVQPTEAQLAEYRQRQEAIVEEKRELQTLVHEPSVSADGVQVQLAANIGSPTDAEIASQAGAEGIGLFRTEFLYMDRDELPSEAEQFAAYKQVAEIMGNRPIVIRTLDIGGDKDLPHFKLPEEVNPFLGYRAIRLCLDRPELFRTQLRAILRASIYGNIKIMYPMIATLEELRAANHMLNEVKKELLAKRIRFNADIDVGMMIEIPAAAFIADLLAEEVDFFSIGTNDLIQYTLAVDRMNEYIPHLYQPFHPALIRLIKQVIDAGHANGIWVGMCGEMAGDPLAIPILLGLELDEFSMGTISILPARKQLRNLRQTEMKSLADSALHKKTAEEVRELVESTMKEKKDRPGNGH